MKSVQDYVRTMLLRRFNKHTALFAEISDRSKYVLGELYVLVYLMLWRN